MMTRRDLLTKLRDGTRLTPAEQECIDLLLEVTNAHILDTPIAAPSASHPWQRYDHAEVLRARKSPRRKRAAARAVPA